MSAEFSCNPGEQPELQLFLNWADNFAKRDPAQAKGFIDTMTEIQELDTLDITE